MPESLPPKHAAKSYACSSTASATLALVLSLASCGTDGGNFPPPTLPPPQAPPQIFSAYRAQRDARMADGWTRGIDMSGVSFDHIRTATLVTPRHVLMAAHFARSASAPVVFHDRHGNRLARKLIALAPGKGDVMVGLLDEEVPPSYKPYPLPAPGSDFSHLIGRPVLVTDKEQCLFVHQVAAIGNGGIQFQYDPAKRHGWGKKLVVGDSGNPSFLIVGKQLVLIETHTKGGPGAGPFFGDPEIQAAIRSAIAKLGGGHPIRTVPVR